MTLDFYESVAARAGTTVALVKDVLEKREIRADRPLRQAKRLLVTAIRFQGEKNGKATGPFDFNWNGLTSGVYGIASERNLVGKSSILEITLWCLRGRPKSLQEDVRKWLHSVSLEFHLDQDLYKVEFEMNDGQPVGALLKVHGNKNLTVDSFNSDDQFEVCMGRFMMDAFDVERIPSRHGRNEEGQTIYHSWPALSGVMYIGGDHHVLLGDVLHGGLSGRMLQMFIGMPWARSLMYAVTHQKSKNDDFTVASRAVPSEAVEALRKQLVDDLKQAQDRLESLRSEPRPEEDISAKRGNLLQCQKQLSLARMNLAKARADLSWLEKQATDDERACLEIKEDALAERFFHGLTPHFCPRCDSPVKEERMKAEVSLMQCCMCNEKIELQDPHSVEELAAGAEARRAASTKAAQDAKDDVALYEDEVKRLSRKFEVAEKELTKAIERDTSSAMTAAEVQVALIQGKLSGLEMKVKAATSVSEVSQDEGAIIDAAHAEAKIRFDQQKDAVLERLNEEICRLAVAFGMRGLETVKLASNSNLSLTKGGSQTSFSKLTTGERLRLRVATTIALLRVGRERGLGRHPGFLIIDSPGSEETSDVDLERLLRELNVIAEEMSDLQVFVASANVPAITETLPRERCRIAASGQEMW